MDFSILYELVLRAWVMNWANGIENLNTMNQSTIIKELMHSTYELDLVVTGDKLQL